MTEIRVSVRRLVEFLLRSGNLESGEGVASYERALEGARIHRRLQKEAGDSYRAEVPFSIPWKAVPTAFLNRTAPL